MAFENVIAVRYVETDLSGIVHHAHYVSYFEVARIHAITQMGLNHLAFEQSGLFMAVTEAGQVYRSPARYGDELTIQTWLREVSRIRMRFAYEITRDSQRIASGFTVLACLLKANGRPSRLPEEILNNLSNHLESE